MMRGESDHPPEGEIDGRDRSIRRRRSPGRAGRLWGVLVLFLSLMLVNVFRMLESTKMLIDGIREETVPLLGEVKVTVTSVNKELDRVDGMLESVSHITASVEKITGLAEQAVSTPLVKIISLSAGLSRAARRFRGDRGGSA